jgi:hypothetical protein
MEWWSDGFKSNTPALQHSSTPGEEQVGGFNVIPGRMGSERRTGKTFRPLSGIAITKG